MCRVANLLIKCREGERCVPGVMRLEFPERGITDYCESGLRNAL